MKHFLLTLALAAGFSAESVQAQVLLPIRTGGRTTRPTVSPYLNLNRGGAPGINYYSPVRPQIETNRNIQDLGQELQQLAPDPNAPFTTGTGVPGVMTTGIEGTGVPNHMYYSHYFPSMPVGGIS